MNLIMKVLVVTSYTKGRISPFVKEQIDAIQEKNVTVEYFLIKTKGLAGYLSHLNKLIGEIKNFQPDLIHAHYGLSGLLANLQRQVPVIITFHGSDINIRWVKYLSGIANRFSTKSIFVSKILASSLSIKEPVVIPCGVPLRIFKHTSKEEARYKLKIDLNKKYILFSSAFDNTVKNYKLAKQAIDLIDEDISLLELIGYTREEVSLLMNACDVVLLSSFSEGSSQFIKEAMACNCPIVSTDVGDVSWVIGNTKGCFITSFDPKHVADKIKLALNFSKKVGKTNGRERIIELGFDSGIVAKKIIQVYQNVLNGN